MPFSLNSAVLRRCPKLDIVSDMVQLIRQKEHQSPSYRASPNPRVVDESFYKYLIMLNAAGELYLSHWSQISKGQLSFWEAGSLRVLYFVLGHQISFVTLENASFHFNRTIIGWHVEKSPWDRGLILVAFKTLSVVVKTNFNINRLHFYKKLQTHLTMLWESPFFSIQVADFISIVLMHIICQACSFQFDC